MQQGRLGTRDLKVVLDLKALKDLKEPRDLLVHLELLGRKVILAQ